MRGPSLTSVRSASMDGEVDASCQVNEKIMGLEKEGCTCAVVVSWFEEGRRARQNIKKT